MALITTDFIKALIENNYTHLCVVPCSFAKNVINEAINKEGIEYLPAASEAVACSIAAGLKMAGKNPIVIVQSSGLTNMASCITSLLIPYGITFPIVRVPDPVESFVQYDAVKAGIFWRNGLVKLIVNSPVPLSVRELTL